MKSIREQLREQGRIKDAAHYLIEASDYQWVRILPEDFYEEGVDAIWCHKEDLEDKPVNINDMVEYRKYNPYEFPGPSALGKVIALFEGIGQVDVRTTYIANHIK